jgi:hypothetical protein
LLKGRKRERDSKNKGETKRESRENIENKLSDLVLKWIRKRVR